MHARTIHNVLAQGRTVQKSGSYPPNPRQITRWTRLIEFYYDAGFITPRVYQQKRGSMIYTPGCLGWSSSSLDS